MNLRLWSKPWHLKLFVIVKNYIKWIQNIEIINSDWNKIYYTWENMKNYEVVSLHSQLSAGKI